MAETAADRARVLALATEALHAASAEDWPAACTAIQAISGGGLLTAIMAWCDTLIGRHPGMAGSRDTPVQVRWQLDSAGPLQHARWAGQVIAARAAMDEAAFMALIRVPAEGEELGAYVSALLQSVAMTLRSFGDG
jgi:hypothetical protein